MASFAFVCHHKWSMQAVYVPCNIVARTNYLFLSKAILYSEIFSNVPLKAEAAKVNGITAGATRKKQRMVIYEQF